MLNVHIALAIAVTALVAAGCGSSSKTTSTATTTSAAAQTSVVPGKPLSRSELLAKGDAICYRLNARRSSLKLERPQDYERIVPPLAAYELAAANEMGQITPPASMANDWQEMVAGSHTIAEATGRFHTYKEANTGKLAITVDHLLGKGIDELTQAAKRAGFKDCARFA